MIDQCAKSIGRQTKKKKTLMDRAELWSEDVLNICTKKNFLFKACMHRIF